MDGRELRKLNEVCFIVAKWYMKFQNLSNSLVTRKWPFYTYWDSLNHLIFNWWFRRSSQYLIFCSSKVYGRHFHWNNYQYLQEEIKNFVMNNMWIPEYPTLVYKKDWWNSFPLVSLLSSHRFYCRYGSSNIAAINIKETTRVWYYHSPVVFLAYTCPILICW